jgi:tagatose 6-phosphate kinase
MILCLGTTPAAQRVMVFPKLSLDAVNRALNTQDGVAGKAINVAKVLHALGAHPVATGFLGGHRGQEIQTALRERGIEAEFVEVATPTRQCITVIDQSAQTITELVEESRPVAPEAYEGLLGIVQKRVRSCQAVVMSGTIASGGPAELYARCTRLAAAAGVLSVMDASGAALLHALRARPGLVKPNRAELEATVGSSLDTEPALQRAMRELHDRGAQRVVITAGARHTLAFDSRHFFRIIPPCVKAQNPIGSGDAFTAGLVWQLAQGAALDEACRWASAVGAANALTLMAGEINRHEVEPLLKEVRLERI